MGTHYVWHGVKMNNINFKFYVFAFAFVLSNKEHFRWGFSGCNEKIF